MQTGMVQWSQEKWFHYYPRMKNLPRKISGDVDYSGWKYLLMRYKQNRTYGVIKKALALEHH